jgi:TolB-like protein/cytochrome c-type biogenesis protein CcmH/NrfG
LSGENSTKLAVLLHADVIGSTALVQLDETLAHARFQDVFRRFSETIAGHGGTTHEIRGDALVAEFSRASDALAAAVTFQAANGEYIDGLGDEIRPQLRIGVAMGEVVIADSTVTGGGIVLAQRLEQLAPPGGICIQGAAYETLPKRLPFEYENLGEQQLKGFDEPVRVYTVRARGEASSSASAVNDVPAPRELELPSKPSIAVLPFNNMSNDSEQEFFADGISEDIITELSKFRTFFVIARNSSFAFKNESLTVRDVGRKLGVRYVVEGSVRRAGNRVRITAQLIDAIDDKHLTSEQQRARRKPTENLDAWECYQRGLWYMFSYSQADQALRYFNRAIELDPEFGSAYAGLAYTYAIQLLLGASEDKEDDLQRGVHAADTALGIDQNDPFAHFARGRISIFKGDHEKAVAEFERAISLNPNYALAHFGLAHGLWHVGRPAEALPHHDEAIRLSPNDTVMWAFLASKAIALVMVERYEEGIARAEEAANALERLRKVEPEISLGFIERSLPMPASEAKDRFLQGLELAGMT